MVVSQSLWDRANAAVAKPLPARCTLQARDKHFHLLKGLIFCGHCARAMTPNASGHLDGNGRAYRYYTCGHAHKDGADADCPIRNVTETAAHLFAIPCFTPQDGLPECWERILKQWLDGVPQQLIFAGAADAEPTDAAYREAGHFIEDGVIYRLTWALEAVRVRVPELIGEEDEALRRIPADGRNAIGGDRLAFFPRRTGSSVLITARVSCGDVPAPTVTGLGGWGREANGANRKRSSG